MNEDGECDNFSIPPILTSPKYKCKKCGNVCSVIGIQMGWVSKDSIEKKDFCIKCVADYLESIGIGEVEKLEEPETNNKETE